MMLCARLSKSLSAPATNILAVTFAIAATALTCESSYAQSRVVSLNSGNASSRPIHIGVRSDLSERISQVEQKLAGPFEPPFEIQELEFKKLVAWLNQIGIPTVVDDSAIENNLDDEQLITHANTQLSVEANLLWILRPYQCTYYIQPSGLLVILSEDAALDNLMRITYDVGQYTADPDEIAYTIAETIDPDSWDDAGGSGRVNVLRTDDRRLIVVSQTYENHVRIRQYLSGINVMIGTVGAGKPLDSVATQGGSRSVLLPGEFDPYANRYDPYGARGAFGQGGGGFGGGLGGGGFGGRGGAGLGGGVF